MLNSIKSCALEAEKSELELDLEDICLKEKELSLLSESPI
jgi:hypothetical protein